jgi:hypothetical protein
MDKTPDVPVGRPSLGRLLYTAALTLVFLVIVAIWWRAWLTGETSPASLTAWQWVKIGFEHAMVVAGLYLSVVLQQQLFFARSSPLYTATYVDDFRRLGDRANSSRGSDPLFQRRCRDALSNFCCCRSSHSPETIEALARLTTPALGVFDGVAPAGSWQLPSKQRPGTFRP